MAINKCDHVLVVGLGLVLVLICWSLALVLILWSSSKSVTFLILHSEAVDIQEVHIIANQIFLRLEHVIVKNLNALFLYFIVRAMMVNVCVVNQKVSFLWHCWCESYQSFIE